MWYGHIVQLLNRRQTMQVNRSMGKFTLIVMGLLVLVVISGATSVMAADPGDLVKQIEKKLSSVNRRIVTDPGRAEKEWLEARDILSKLKALASGHEKLAALEKSHKALAQKLEKRLGRPIGGAKADTKEKAKEKKPAAEEPKAASSDLPSSVLSRLHKINAALDAVAVGLEKNQLATAKRKLGEANKLMEEIQKRYAKKIPEGNEQMKAATARLKMVGANYAKDQAAAEAKAAAEAEIRAKREEQSQKWITQMSPYFDYDNDLCLRIGSSFNSGTEEEQKLYRKAYDKANALMAEYEKVQFPHGKTQELDQLEYRLTDYLVRYNEGEKRAKQAEACREWVDTLRAYVDTGAGSQKYLIASAIFGEDEINRRAALFEEAKGVWADYQKAEFPLGKSPKLVDLEKEMQQRLAEMPESLRQSRALVSGEIEKEYDRVLAYLERDTGWKKNISKRPNIAMERDIKPLREALKRYAGTVESNDAKLASLRAKMAQIEKIDQANRAICAERTYMLPGKYSGNDVTALEETVKAIVKDKLPKAKPLRVTLPAANWKEERVVEWTDTTQTAIRYRSTRFMTAQIAAKDKDGKVYLHSVHLASDRTSDGSWGPLYGHTMWADWMAEENVNKKPPTP